MIFVHEQDKKAMSTWKKKLNHKAAMDICLWGEFCWDFLFCLVLTTLNLKKKPITRHYFLPALAR